LDFEGTVLMVSHDRAFMDNVITSLIVLDGQGEVNEYVGGYSDWVARGGSLSDARAGAAKAAEDAVNLAPVTPDKQKKNTGKSGQAKLSYKDQRELGTLPLKIEKLEKLQAQLEQQMSEPGFYQSDRERIQQVTQELTQVQAQLEAAFNRWGELEDV
jgi:ATP-binding cassette subfamily F protein uup